MKSLQRQVCEACLERAGVSRKDFTLDKYWPEGKVLCPPQYLVVTEQEALASCPMRACHEGSARITGEKD